LAGGIDATSTPTAVTNNLLTAASLNPGVNAQATLSLINSAIANVASLRGVIGANINRLQAASNVEIVQVQSLTAAEDQITAANIPQQVMPSEPITREKHSTHTVQKRWIAVGRVGSLMRLLRTAWNRGKSIV
jgi:hypothetical protein